MKSINKLFIPLLLLVAVAGCKKSFLDRPSQSQIASNNFYQSTKEIRLATASLYGGPSAWQWHHQWHFTIWRCFKWKWNYWSIPGY